VCSLLGGKATELLFCSHVTAVVDQFPVRRVDGRGGAVGPELVVEVALKVDMTCILRLQMHVQRQGDGSPTPPLRHPRDIPAKALDGDFPKRSTGSV
jgi:hypothetical protein